jgi:hypothetical protein
MDYYQGTVTEYLRADRSVFINTECLIQIKPGKEAPKGSSWYCDAIAVDFRAKTIFLCEASYSESQQTQIKRIKEWNDHWMEICDALANKNYNNLPSEWQVRPWLFVPGKYLKRLLEGLESIRHTQELNLVPRITILEMVQPWEYCNYDRQGEKQELKPVSIPQKWRE